MAQDYNIQMHNFNGTDYDNLYPRTYARMVIMADGKTAEEAITAGGGGSLLTVTFDEVFAGQEFTVSYSGSTYSAWSFTGTVPTSSPYTASCTLPYTSSNYNITCAYDGTTYTATATTAQYYGSLTAEVKRATLNITFGTGLAGQTFHIRKTSVTGTSIYNATIPSDLTASVGVAPGATYYVTVAYQNLTYSGSVNAASATSYNVAVNTCAVTISVPSTITGQSYTFKSGNTTVKTGTSATSLTVYVPRTSATVTYTTTSKSANGGVTFTGSASITTSSSTASITISAPAVTITFASDFVGKTFTATGTGVSISAAVPTSKSYVAYVPANMGTLTISCDGFSTSTNVGTSNVAVTLNSVQSVLDNNSYAVIQSVSNAGTGPSYWSVGDRKGVVLNGTCGCKSFSSKTVYMSILGFDHNKSKESSSAHTIYFQFGWDALTGGNQIAFTDSYGSPWTYADGTRMFVMNTTNTNVGGWNSSYMRTTICGQNKSTPSAKSFMSCLPSDLRNVLKAVTLYTDNTGNSSNVAANVTTTTDYIWLPAEFEVFGTRSYANQYEQNQQVQYDYYKGVSAGSTSKNAFTAAGKIRYNDQSTSSAVHWWERSAYYNYAASFCRVNYNGSADTSDANTSYGFAPCLCI